MGYRSEVYIAVPKKDEAQLDVIMNEHKLLDNHHPHGEPSFKKYNHQREYIVIYEGDWLKWFEGYKEVDAINSFIHSDDTNRAIVCVGEDNVIHGEIGDYQEVFNIYTKVDII